MAEETSLRITVLGDVVGSRRSGDRAGLHDRLATARSLVNEQVSTDQPLAIVNGDEFQGSYSRRGEALHAVLLLRSLLSPEVDLRFGIGRGEVTVLDTETGTQDGPGWWAARDAIDAIKAGQHATGWTAWRTAYRDHDPEPDPALEPAINAALVCQDLMLGSLDKTGWTIVRGMMQDRTQASMAEELGITRQAVQQRRKSAGLPMLLESIQRLQALP